MTKRISGVKTFSWILLALGAGACAPQAEDSAASQQPILEELQAAGEGLLEGMKYYDANENGRWDEVETTIPNWPIAYTDANGVTRTVLTGPDGHFQVRVPAGVYRVAEVLPPASSGWVQTGNVILQTYSDYGASVVLNADKSYTATVVVGGRVLHMKFGNVCHAPPATGGGGHTPGFWSNRNGQALVDADDLASLARLNLRDAAGGAFDPASYQAFAAWILNRKATNMAFQLSGHLAAMHLNVRNGFVNPAALVVAPGTHSADAAGHASIAQLIAEADASLGTHGYTHTGAPERAYQEALKDALDRANNDQNWVTAATAGGAAACVPPSLPAAPEGQ